MHVSSITSTLCLDPNPNNNSYWYWVLQFLITVFIVSLGFLYLLRSTASKFFAVDANFNSSSSPSSSSSSSSSYFSMAASAVEPCAVCSQPASKHCAGCKSIKYCSQTCQAQHWRSEHKRKCQKVQSSGNSKSLQLMGGKRRIALVPSTGSDKIHKVVDKVLFPYDEFVKLYNWEKSIFPPCGLLNCGNSCFANVVLQCLAHTRPLLVYLLEKGHRRDCRRIEWCFLCELELHMTRASRSQQPFSPINILSRLPSIGGNLGSGEQEDAHEFMRFAIDTMQSVCLDEHGGEKFINPKSQETTLIQHIFGGQLRSQVICTKCNQVSDQYENMMDLTVEIQGDATSLQECLDQFTAEEWLHGENMYKCDGCNDYVKAAKRLTIHQAPHVLTIALKRFQSGRFGKINKKITFPEDLDLTPYMSEKRDGMDKYKLYAVVVHVDMLNASFFGHYICYTKGFEEDWYRIDDCKVTRVELDEVLSQGAYMLLYRRISARPKCLKTFELASNQRQDGEKLPSEVNDSSNSLKPCNSNSLLANLAPEPLFGVDHEPINGDLEDSGTVNPVSSLPVSVGTEILGNEEVQSVFSSPSCSNSHGELPDIPESSAVSVNAVKDSSHEGLAATEVSDKEHRSEDNDQTTGVSGKIDSVIIDQNAPCEMTCFGDESVARSSRQTSEKRTNNAVYHGLDKEENPVLSDDMEVDSVELNEPDDCSNGVIHSIMYDESPTNTCGDTPPEKFS